MAADEIPPSKTIYAKNLNEGVKIPALVESLREAFSVFGTIVDIIAKKSLRRKGQAFVVFESQEDATSALETLQGFELHGKEMQLAYSKTRSDATVKAEDPKEKFDEHVGHRLAVKERKNNDQKAKEAAAAADANKKRHATDDLPDRATKTAKTGAAGAAGAVPDEYNPPNKTLVIRGLPDSYTKEEIETLYSKYAGFKEASMVARLHIGFVLFQDAESAIGPKEETNGMMVEENMLRVTYQKPAAAAA